MFLILTPKRQYRIQASPLTKLLAAFTIVTTDEIFERAKTPSENYGSYKT